MSALALRLSSFVIFIMTACSSEITRNPGISSRLASGGVEAATGLVSFSCRCSNVKQCLRPLLGCNDMLLLKLPCHWSLFLFVICGLWRASEMLEEMAFKVSKQPTFRFSVIYYFKSDLSCLLCSIFPLPVG